MQPYLTRGDGRQNAPSLLCNSSSIGHIELIFLLKSIFLLMTSSKFELTEMVIIDIPKFEVF